MSEQLVSRGTRGERNDRPPLVEAALDHLRETISKRLRNDPDAEARLVEILGAPTPTCSDRDSDADYGGAIGVPPHHRVEIPGVPKELRQSDAAAVATGLVHSHVLNVV